LIKPFCQCRNSLSLRITAWITSLFTLNYRTHAIFPLFLSFQRVYIITWNVGSAVPPDDITSLFGPNVSDGNIDMFIIGLQEVNSMINKRLKDVLFSDQWSELCMDTLSPFGYVLVASQRMQGVLLLVFSKFCHLPFLRGVQTQSTRTGLGGYWGNKGGVSARMTMFGHPVCFLNCHLPAHMRNLEQRMEDFESILQQQQFEGGAATGVLDHDVVFWFGDLNFRIEDYDIHVVKCAIDSNKLPLLWERDQLNMAKNTELILEGFMEGQLKFPPTYKFDVGTHTYDTSAKKRKPAWTDRILWRLRRTGSPVPTHNAALQRGLTSWLGGATKVTQHAYRSHMSFTISDHKPVSALFSLHFPFRVDMPLVELQVNKEWCKASDATVRFTVASTYQRSSWDWVAIYKVGFRHHKDYQAYVWAKAEHATQVTFSEEDLPRDDCEYILGYYSHNMNSIVGLSSPIQVTRIIEQREANAFLLVKNRSRYTGTIISHFIRYVFLAPGLGQGAAKHSSEIWVHIDIIGSHTRTFDTTFVGFEEGGGNFTHIIDM
uniref:Phosphatidylinositol 4,5-bisphosphate 5-phosphatase A n=1 Tax=Astatotilapia calliptera TaxID=8154 RepID=A0AAX7VWI7_ASTCA